MSLQTDSLPDEPRRHPANISNHPRATVGLLRFGCVLVILVAALATQAQDIFMRIGGQAAAMGSQQTTPTLAGESTDPQYTNWISVLSMSHGVSRPVAMGGGGSAAAPDHQDLHFMKGLDKTSPSLNLLVNGAPATVTQPIDYVTIDFRKSQSSEVFYRIELQGVYLTSNQVGGAKDNGTPTESVSLVYTKIKWSYVKYVSGKAQTPITTGWDVAAQKAL
jgi:type VI secretion system Hcp family effector